MALRSMTGIGVSKACREGLEITVEIKSVNHRFLDINLKLPSAYSEFEGNVLKLVRDSLNRGRIDVFVDRSLKGEKGEGARIQFNQELFKDHLRILEEAKQAANLKDTKITSNDLLYILQRKDVVEVVAEEKVMEDEEVVLMDAVRGALSALVQMREKEGKALEGEFLKLLTLLEKQIRIIEEQAGQISALFYERLKGRLNGLKPEVNVDESRLAQEVALLAERTDITEELSRLSSHMEQFRSVITAKQSEGKKLIFLLQEMSREINTIGAKAQNSTVSKQVIEGKLILEKLREQAQNVE